MLFTRFPMRFANPSARPRAHTRLIPSAKGPAPISCLRRKRSVCSSSSSAAGTASRFSPQKNASAGSGRRRPLEELPHRHARIYHRKRFGQRFYGFRLRDIIAVAGVGDRHEAHPFGTVHPAAQFGCRSSVHRSEDRAPRLRRAAAAARIESLADHGSEKSSPRARWG